MFNLGIRIITDLKQRLFAHVLRLGLDFHELHPPGKLISRVESDTETLKELFGDVAVNLLRSALLFIGILGMMLYSDFRAAVWIFALVPLLFAGTFAYMTFMRKYWRQARTQNAQMMGYVTSTCRASR